MLLKRLFFFLYYLFPILQQGIPVAYDSSLPQNGVNVNMTAPISVPYTRFGAQPVGGYAMPGSQWVPGYMMAQPVAQVDDQVIIKVNKKSMN